MNFKKWEKDPVERLHKQFYKCSLGLKNLIKPEAVAYLRSGNVHRLESKPDDSDHTIFPNYLNLLGFVNTAAQSIKYLRCYVRSHWSIAVFFFNI